MPQGLDIILVATMLSSGFLAMLRGLTREMLSIMSWALAALATLVAYTHFKDDVRNLIEQRTFADATLIGVVFITSLILFHLLTTGVSDRVLDSRISALDRTLGFAYGLARGLLLVVIAYLIASQLLEVQNMPKWVNKAWSLEHVIDPVGDVIKSNLSNLNLKSLFKKPAQPGAPAG